MKTKSILIFLLFSIIISSCGKHFSLEKRHYRKGFYFAQNHKASSSNVATFAKAPKAQMTHEGLGDQKELSLEAIQTNYVLKTEDVKPDSSLFNNQKTKTKNADIHLQRKAQLLLQQLALSEKNEKKLNRFIGHKQHTNKKDAGNILLDILLIFLGIAAAVFFIFLVFILLLDSASGHSTLAPKTEQNLAGLCAFIAVLCVYAPFKKLINDL